MGWVAGQAELARPPLEPGGYDICDLWSALSRFLPSQHEGKMTVARMPPGQVLAGNSDVSLLSQGAKPSPLPLQRWQMPGMVPALPRRAASPETMRKP